MKIYLYGYNTASQGLKELSLALGVKRLKHQNSTFKPKKTRAVVNWGSSSCPYNPDHLGALLNKPAAVAKVTNKITAFKLFDQHCRVPDWSEDKDDADAWQIEGSAVMARKIVNGHSGLGIVYCGEDDVIPPAPLYTRYVKKVDEYRVHLFRGTASFFIQRKARKTEHGTPNWHVRNLAGGFVYASTPEAIGNVPPDVLTQARAAFEHSGLDFGAVDVIWNSHEQQAYVLEINTAPGLQGRTLEFYKTTLKEVLN